MCQDGPCLDSIQDELPDDVRDEAQTSWRFAGQEEVKAGPLQGLPAGKEKGGRELSFLWGRETHFPASAPRQDQSKWSKQPERPAPRCLPTAERISEAEPHWGNMTMSRNYTQQHGKTSHT